MFEYVNTAAGCSKSQVSRRRLEDGCDVGRHIRTSVPKAAALTWTGLERFKQISAEVGKVEVKKAIVFKLLFLFRFRLSIFHLLCSENRARFARPRSVTRQMHSVPMSVAMRGTQNDAAVNRDHRQWRVSVAKHTHNHGVIFGRH